MKPKAILLSDLHIAEWATFNHENQRTLEHFRVLSRVRALAIKYKVPVLFMGDLFHVPQSITNNLLDIVTKEFSKLDSKPWKLYAISGNHDMSKKNSAENPSPSLVKSLSRAFNFLDCIDFQTIDMGDFVVTGIPYLDQNIGLNEAIKTSAEGVKKPHVLLLHTDYQGARDTDGTEVGSVQNFNTNLLKPYKVVLIGHIHKPQKMSPKVYMVGATHQQRRTDRDCELGYWLLDEGFVPHFRALDTPKFIDVEDEANIQEDGNYYTVVAKASVTKDSIEVPITKDMDPSKVARRYLRAIGEKDKDKKRVLTKLLSDVI